ncbi:hypothetical protein [Vibrio maritimus]|uniref:hypothetical protein n=1 Tax=Vibrio maritimus TaxID=990268 RepID=UPI0037370B14
MRRTNDIAVCMNYEVTETDTQCPQPLCKKAAQIYLSELKHSLGSTDAASPIGEKILVLACLALVHSQTFVDYRLPLKRALKGQPLVTEPDWSLDYDKRIKLIQILHLLTNMVQRKHLSKSTIIAEAYRAALELFEDIECGMQKESPSGC